MNKNILILVIILAIIIVGLIGIIVFLPRPTERPPTPIPDVIPLIKAGQEIASPLLVEGSAKGTWFFEASFPIKITDEQGNVLGTSFVQAQSDWMTEDLVPFEGEISFISKTGGKGFLVFAKDNPSGLPQNDKEFRLPVILKPTETMMVKAYFNNNKLDPQISCNKVFAVEREVPKTVAVGKDALNELLKGPTQDEKNQGFFTSINSGVKIQSLTIDSGTAYVDFDSQLEYQVGGSCKVSAIRAEITETLKQFSTVKNVIISINGRTEDILQP